MSAEQQPTYELWDADSANRMGVYSTVDAALRDIRRFIWTGRDSCDGVGLIRLTGDDEDAHVLIAEGADLYVLAQAGG